MDFSLTVEQRMMKDSIASFVQRELVPFERELIKRELGGGSGYPTLTEIRGLQRKGKAAGFWGLDTPKEYGGLDLDPLSLAVANEELGKTFVEFAFGGRAATMLYAASESQKRDYLLPVLQGERFGVLAMTEPGSGSDARTAKTHAEFKSGQWVINGHKQWISFGAAPEADFAMVFARTRDEEGQEGISVFLVDRDMGYKPVRTQMMGIHDTSEIYFDDVKVPASALLGKLNRGFEMGMRFMYRNRWYVSSKWVGSAQVLTQMALDQAMARETFGRKLADRENIQWMITESEVELRAARFLIWNSAWQESTGTLDYRHSANAAKLYGAGMVNRVVDRVLQIFGAMGYAKETGIERWMRDMRAFRIWEGTDEIMRSWLFNSLRSHRAEVGALN